MFVAQSGNNPQILPSPQVIIQPVDELGLAFQTLLEAVKDTLGATVAEDNPSEQPLTFEVCLNGYLYHVCIEEHPQTTELPGRRLSLRELEIARLIARGLSNKAIALALSLSPCTVSTYTKRIYLKLNVSSRTEMVAKVLRERSLHFFQLNA